MAKVEYYKIANNKDFLTSNENQNVKNIISGATPDVDFDALMPFSQLRQGTADSQYENM